MKAFFMLYFSHMTDRVNLFVLWPRFKHTVAVRVFVYLMLRLQGAPCHSLFQTTQLHAVPFFVILEWAQPREMFHRRVRLHGVSVTIRELLVNSTLKI